MSETQERIKSLSIEGIIIVISILLAFAIDAMWAQHQVEQEEELALVALKSEYADNLQQLDFVIDYHVMGRTHMSKLFMLSEEELRKLPQKEISDIMLSTSNPVTFDPILGTSKSLIDSGKLGILESQDLRSAITSFLTIIADIEEDEYYMREGALDIWRAEVGHGGPWTDPDTERSVNGAVQGFDFYPKVSHDDLISVRSDEKYKTLTLRYHLNVGYYLLELSRARENIQTILQLIEDD